MRAWGTAVIGWTMCLFGGIWTYVLWVMRAVECFKHCLMGHISRSMEYRGAKSYLNCWELTQEVQRILVSSDILVKKVATFALVQRVCLRLKAKSFGLIVLAEEISK